MKIENKECDWQRCHKSTQRGNICGAWRRAHKKARTVWKGQMFMGKYEMLAKRV